jgi:hypothetical protein
MTANGPSRTHDRRVVARSSSGSCCGARHLPQRASFSKRWKSSGVTGDACIRWRLSCARSVRTRPGGASRKSSHPSSWATLVASCQRTPCAMLSCLCRTVQAAVLANGWCLLAASTADIRSRSIRDFTTYPRTG